VLVVGICALAALLVSLTGCGRHPVRFQWEQRLLAADRSFDQGDLEAAQAEYSLLVDQTRRSSDLRYLAFQQAWILEKTGAGARALRAYEAMWITGERDEYAARAVYRAGRVLLDQFGDRAGARRVWERLVRSRPDRAVADRAILDLLQMHDEEGDLPGAFELLDRLYASIRHTNLADNLLYELAARLREAGHRNAAELAYRRMLERHPGTGLSDDARWHLAELLVERGQLHPALIQLKLLTEDRDSSWQVGIYESNLADDARFWRGVLLYRHGESERAEEEFRRLYSEFPESILRDDARFNVAVCRHDRGDISGALEACDDLRDAEPESRWASRCDESARGVLASPGVEAFVAGGAR
jgi:TolA-binding protein